MSTQLDFISLKSASVSERSLIFGYIRTNFIDTATQSSENLIHYTILAFYYDNCDIFNTFMENYDISPDGKCFSGCGYGKYQIDPNDTRYDRYQWMIRINACLPYSHGIMFGITAFADTTRPWCDALQPIQYDFHSRGDYMAGTVFDGPEYDHMEFENTPFQTNDIIILELDTKLKEFKLFVNGRLGGCHKNINSDRDTRYRLACLVSDGVHFITLEGFSKFKDNQENTLNNLLNYNGNFSQRNHPNGEVNVDHAHMIRIVFKPISTQYRKYRYFHQNAPKWDMEDYEAASLHINIDRDA